MKKLENYNVKKMSVKEIMETEGGKVPFWYYFVAPGAAYIISKFEDGCECDVM